MLGALILLLFPILPSISLYTPLCPSLIFKKEKKKKKSFVALVGSLPTDIPGVLFPDSSPNSCTLIGPTTCGLSPRRTWPTYITATRSISISLPDMIHHRSNSNSVMRPSSFRTTYSNSCHPTIRWTSYSTTNYSNMLAHCRLTRLRLSVPCSRYHKPSPYHLLVSIR